MKLLILLLSLTLAVAYDLKLDDLNKNITHICTNTSTSIIKYSGILCRFKLFNRVYLDDKCKTKICNYKIAINKTNNIKIYRKNLMNKECKLLLSKKIKIIDISEPQNMNFTKCANSAKSVYYGTLLFIPLILSFVF